MQRELEAPSDDRLPMPRDPEEGPAPSVLAVLPRALPVGRQAPTNTPPESTEPGARAGLAGLAGSKAPGARASLNTWPQSLHLLVAMPTAAAHTGQSFFPVPGARAGWANSRLQCVHFLDAAPTTLPHPPSAVGHKKTTGVVGPLAALGAGAPLMAGPNSAGLASAGTTPGVGSTGITGMASAGTALLTCCTHQRGLPCRHPGHRVWPGTRPHLRLAGSVATSVQHFAHACMRAM